MGSGWMNLDHLMNQKVQIQSQYDIITATQIKIKN